MHLPTESVLESCLAEVVMRALFPVDLGDGIEVVHELETLEIEMDCEIDDDAAYSDAYERLELEHEPAAGIVPAPGEWMFHAHLASPDVRIDLERSPIWDTLPFAPYEPPDVAEDLVTGRFTRVDSALVRDTLADTVPYPRLSPLRRRSRPRHRS